MPFSSPQHGLIHRGISFPAATPGDFAVKRESTPQLRLIHRNSPPSAAASARLPQLGQIHRNFASFTAARGQGAVNILILRQVRLVHCNVAPFTAT
jgi:hypothetical protein